MTSIGNQLRRLSGLQGTRDLSEWEAQFLESVLRRVGATFDTRGLSAKQVATIEALYRRHFA